MWYKVPGAGKYSIHRQTQQIRNDKSGRILKIARNNGGYMHACLMQDDGKARTTYVHRIMAELFVRKREGCDVVNHKNFVRDDNREDNLEWVTQSQNLLHFWDNSPADQAAKFRSRRGKNMLLFERAVRSLRERFQTMDESSQAAVIKAIREA